MDFMQAQYEYDGYLASFYRKEVHRLLVPFQLNTGLMCLSVFRLVFIVNAFKILRLILID